MATNKITVKFTPCIPAPAAGYRVFYRPIGTTVYRSSSTSTVSPIIIIDTNDAANTRYEGYVQSDCGNNHFGEAPPVFITPTLVTGTVEFVCSDSGCSNQGGISLNFVFDSPTPPNLTLLFGAIVRGGAAAQYVGNQIFSPPAGSIPWSYYNVHGTSIPFEVAIPEGVTTFSAGEPIFQQGFNGDVLYATWICHGVGYPNGDSTCLIPLSDVYIKVTGATDYQAALTSLFSDVNVHNQV